MFLFAPISGKPFSRRFKNKQQIFVIFWNGVEMKHWFQALTNLIKNVFVDFCAGSSTLS